MRLSQLRWISSNCFVQIEKRSKMLFDIFNLSKYCFYETWCVAKGNLTNSRETVNVSMASSIYQTKYQYAFFYHWYRINRLNEKTSRKFIYTFTIYMYCSSFFIKIRERIIKGLLMEFHLSAILLNTYLPSIPIDLLREYIQTRSFFSVSWIE